MMFSASILKLRNPFKTMQVKWWCSLIYDHSKYDNNKLPSTFNATFTKLEQFKKISYGIA